jgi:DNA gyrase subunit A
LYSLDPEAAPLALGTVKGVVKRVVPEYKGWDSWEVITLKDDDAVIGCAHATDSDDLVFITSDAQLLRLSARETRPQGRPAGGMAGIKLAEDATVLFFGAIPKSDRDTAIVATLATGPDSAASVKTTAVSEYPAKGRATAGVRTQRFLKGQDHLLLAWAGLPPVRACDAKGAPRNLPACEDRRDGTGTKVYGPFFAFGSGTIK